MSIRDWFRRDRRPHPDERATASPQREPSAIDTPERTSAWLMALESGTLRIPGDVHDPGAWNGYWRKQIELRALDQGFNDMMSSDTGLIPLLNQRGAKKILCAGTGLSGEPLSLALHGFDVTALDLSDVPREMFAARVRAGTHPVNRIPGLTVLEEASVAFPPDQAIDPDGWSPMHRSEGHPLRGGGSLTHVTGDLIDPQICPGSFDAVIERRTVQLFPAAEQHAALDRLAARLATRALFVSHQHRGNWKPPQPLCHYAADWVEARGFASADAAAAPDADRIARLRLSTG